MFITVCPLITLKCHNVNDIDARLVRQKCIYEIEVNYVKAAIYHLKLGKSGGKEWLHSNHITHWGQVTHIYVSRLTITGSDNGLSPGRRQAITWTNAVMLFNWTLRNKFKWIHNRNLYISIQENVFEMSYRKWRPFCLGLNVLIHRTAFLHKYHLQCHAFPWSEQHVKRHHDSHT